MDIYRYFRENYNGHSTSNAYLCALLSYYIYSGHPPGSGAFECRFKELFRRFSETNPFEFEIFSDDDVEAAILWNSRMVLVCFRGTDSPGEWLGNLGNAPSGMRAAPASWGSNVRVHSGNYNTLGLVYQSVRSVVRSKTRNSNRKVFLTGHSRGGALATLCAYRFQKVGSVNVSGVYVFGSPRLGNFGFRACYEKDAQLWDKTFRWVKNNDFASKWPDYALHVPTPASRYYHVGRLNFISASGRVTMNHSNPDYEPGPLLSNNDHDMLGYCVHMFQRLSSRSRISQTNPNYLVKGDLPLLGLPG